MNIVEGFYYINISNGYSSNEYANIYTHTHCTVCTAIMHVLMENYIFWLTLRRIYIYLMLYLYIRLNRKQEKLHSFNALGLDINLRIWLFLSYAIIHKHIHSNLPKSEHFARSHEQSSMHFCFGNSLLQIREICAMLGNEETREKNKIWQWAFRKFD